MMEMMEAEKTLFISWINNTEHHGGTTRDIIGSKGSGLDVRVRTGLTRWQHRHFE